MHSSVPTTHLTASPVNAELPLSIDVGDWLQRVTVTGPCVLCSAAATGSLLLLTQLRSALGTDERGGMLTRYYFASI